MSDLPRAPAAVYRSRVPLESDFHRLVRGQFDTFRAVYGEQYARVYGYWRPVIDKTVLKFLKCGDLAHGFARVRCGDCGHDFFVAFSCKQRCICPSCAQKRTLLTGLHVAEDICRRVPHRQFVWTMPKRFRVFFRFHRGLLQRLPKLAWETVVEAYRAVLGAEARPGGIVAIQTFGTLIHFHPHLHGLITDGAFMGDGSFRHVPVNLTHEPFLKLWEHKVFGLLLEEGLIEEKLVAQMRSWKHSGFHVDRSVRIEAGDTAALNRLAQYMARCPFSLARLLRITPEGKVIYKADKEHCREYPLPAEEGLFGGAPPPSRNFQVFEPLDFLAELTQHIPNQGEHLIRYYGCYSNKVRGRAQAAGGETGNPVADATAAMPSATPSADRDARRRWAMLIKRVYQVDPLVCPKCGGAMRIVAFIEARQGEVIRKILEHCGLWHEPPPPRGPPVDSPAWERPASSQAESGVAVDPEFLEHLRREAQGEQMALGWPE